MNNFIENMVDRLTKKTFEAKVNDISNKLWGVKASEYVKFSDGSYGVLFEDGTTVEAQEFMVRELARQRNRDIYTKRALLGLGAFVIVGKSYKVVERVVKL